MANKIRGRGVIAGVALGRIRLAGQNIDGYLAKYQPEAVEVEVEKASDALIAVAEAMRERIVRLQEQKMMAQAAIIEAQRLMVQDPMMAENIAGKVAEIGNAPEGVMEAAESQARVFEDMQDDYFSARATDLRDVGKRIAKYILGVKEPEIGSGKVILCGQEVEPSVIAEIPTEKIAGVLLGSGSTTCHAVIIAKARAIPTIAGLGDKIDGIRNGDYVIMDGGRGDILVRPSQQEIDDYLARMRRQVELASRYQALRELPAKTKDGHRVNIMANIGTHMDVDTAIKTYGAEGVGLFRSEFLFMGHKDIPDEEEQFRAYRGAVEKCQGRPCIIRTMDIGGDKPLPYLHVPPENNPFLGWRAVRISLQRRDIFMPQLKAILRAGLYGDVSIMVPMIINVEELQQVRDMVEEAKVELAHEGQAYYDTVPIGVMVETPAAAIMSPILAKYADFFSIGTNDLIQYTLAVDRTNATISSLYDPFHPAVLRLVKNTIQSARDNDIWVGMCGEMASDPYAAILLVAMGIDEVSMSAPWIPRVKEMIRSVTLHDAKDALARVMKMEDGHVIRKYLRKRFPGNNL